MIAEKPMGVEAAKALGEALKVNTGIISLKLRIF